MNTDHRITLPDGRALAFAEFGRLDGHPVMYFHGSPSSRFEPLLVGDAVLAGLGLRVIAADRPGIGGSDFQLGRGFSEWPRDVAYLADHLGLERFSVMGLSGGGPYVAACAALIPERIRSAVIVSGGWRMDLPEARSVPLPNRLMMTLAKRAPFLLRLMLKMMGGIAQGEREKELAQLKKRVPPADYACFAEPGRLEAFAESMRGALQQGARGAAWDLRLYMREFDFRPSDVRVPITWFHGEQDTNSPIALAHRAVAELPGAQLVTFPNDAHLSVMCNHTSESAEAISQFR